jgi:PAS domain S-box-containing protein
MTEQNIDLSALASLTSGINMKAAIKAGYVDSMSDALVVADVSGKIVFFNPAAEKMFGYAASQIEGQNVKALIPERFHEVHDQHMARFWKNPEPREMGADRKIFYVDINKDEIEATASVTPMRIAVPFGQDGRVAATAIRKLSKLKPQGTTEN